MKKIICLLVILVPLLYAIFFDLPNTVFAQSCTAITYPGCTGGNACYDFAIYQEVQNGDTNCIVADLFCQINPFCTKITGNQCCTDPKLGYDYCQGIQSEGGCSPPNYVGSRCCSNPTPTPSPTPTPTPSPTPTPTPPAGCQNNAQCGVCKQCCDARPNPNYCSSYGYYCAGSQIPGCWANPSPSPSSNPSPSPSGSCPVMGCSYTQNVPVATCASGIQIVTGNNPNGCTGQNVCTPCNYIDGCSGLTCYVPGASPSPFPSPTPSPVPVVGGVQKFMTELLACVGDSSFCAIPSNYHPTVTATPGSIVYFKITTRNANDRNDQFDMLDKFNTFPQDIWGNTDHSRGIYINEGYAVNRYSSSLPGFSWSVDDGAFNSGDTKSEIFWTKLTSTAQTLTNRAFTRDSQYLTPANAGYCNNVLPSLTCTANWHTDRDTNTLTYIDFPEPRGCRADWIQCLYRIWFYSNNVNVIVPPPIGPWIQVTGDVHSNGRINAPGGP